MDRTVKVLIGFIGMYGGVRTEVSNLCANGVRLRNTNYYYCKTLLSGADFNLMLLAVKKSQNRRPVKCSYTIRNNWTYTRSILVS